MLKDASVSFSLKTKKSTNSTLATDISNFFINFVSMDIKYVKNIDLSTQCLFINIMVNKVAVRAIVNSGAPGNTILTKLVKKLGLMPDNAHKLVFGTAGPASTISLGAYGALPLCFGSLQVSAPAIILENQIMIFLLAPRF